MTQTPTPLALDVVVPVYNEQSTLEHSVRTLHAYLRREFELPWQITIADNASTDQTAQIADLLAIDLRRIRVVHLPEKGRGRALKQAWSTSDAAVLVYLDEDLSTDLSALPPLVAPLFSGHSDLAIGTRLTASSRVVRGGRREFISRGYNLLLRTTMAVRFTDAQCGFKAIRRDVAERLLPLVHDDAWFFDTELLVLAERAGLRIHEIPVDWVDDPDSSVDIAGTALDDLRGMARVGWGFASGRIPIDAVYAELGRRPLDPPRRPSFFGQVVRFGVIGVFSTLAFALLYGLLQTVLPAQGANFVALLFTTLGNTWANRRFTFGVRGPERALRHHAQGLVVFGLAWAVTAGALGMLHALRPDATPVTEIVVLTAANLVATVLRFVLLRLWVFRPRRSDAATGPSVPAPTSAPTDTAELARPVTPARVEGFPLPASDASPRKATRS